MQKRYCRFCGEELTEVMIDLGHAPLSDQFLTETGLFAGQYHYPLLVEVCSKCFLAQAAAFEKQDAIFSDYAYFSSYSQTWLDHCKNYVEMIVPRLGLSEKSHVLEIACNDGYLLQYFRPYDVPVKGIDPAHNVVLEAQKKGIEVQCDFFNLDTAKVMASHGEQYDLIIGNNVLAHTPELNSFVAGVAVVLKKDGTATFEFPHLLQLIENIQFDTIYHEHFSYFSFGTVVEIFKKHGLKIYDVEELVTHGGSIRIYATHQDNELYNETSHVKNMIELETKKGLRNIETYRDFARKAKQIKLNALKTFAEICKEGKRIAAFGAAAKGNTFLNYCGIDRDMIDFVVDFTPYKQGRYTPGSLIPVVSMEVLVEKKPDYVLILPWNWTDEIVKNASCIREWGGKFITCIPDIKIF